jgi:hypothetical protein
MSSYSVSNLFGMTGCDAYGQSFTPTDGGPDGESAPPNATLTLTGFSISLANYLPPGTKVTVYLYDTPVGAPEDIGQPEGLVGCWDNQNTGGSGSGSSAPSIFVNLNAGDVLLNSSQSYFIYLSEPQCFLVRTDSAYQGGAVTDYDFTVIPEYTAVFTVETEDWPDDS